VIQNQIEDQLSDSLLSDKFQRGDTILIDSEEEALTLRRVVEEQEDEAEAAVAAG
jgi:ATP-dependent Clp protease ATP-binding subunit ClpA